MNKLNTLIGISYLLLIPGFTGEANNEITYEINFVTKVTKHEVLATKYNPVPGQCDSDPLVTADNSKIDLTLLENYELRWIAISRDLKEHYNFGDTVYVDCDNPKLCGHWVIHDVMNKRFTKRIDFLCPVDDNYEFNKPTKVTINKV